MCVCVCVCVGKIVVLVVSPENAMSYWTRPVACCTSGVVQSMACSSLLALILQIDNADVN